MLLKILLTCLMRDVKICKEITYCSLPSLLQILVGSLFICYPKVAKYVTQEARHGSSTIQDPRPRMSSMTLSLMPFLLLFSLITKPIRLIRMHIHPLCGSDNTFCLCLQLLPTAFHLSPKRASLEGTLHVRNCAKVNLQRMTQ